MASSMSGWPVRTITSAEALDSFIRFRVSIPPMPGIFRSSRTTSKSRAARMWRASFPLATHWTEYPIRPSSLSIKMRNGSSSSTTSTRMSHHPFSLTGYPSTSLSILLHLLYHRQRDDYGSPLAHALALDFNGSLMLLDDAQANWQAEACPLPRFFRREEGIDNLTQILGCDAAAVVGNRERGHVRLTERSVPCSCDADSNSHLSAVLHGVQCVRQDVEEKLLK